MAREKRGQVWVKHPIFAPKGLQIPEAHLPAFEKRGYTKFAPAISAPEGVEKAPKPHKPKKDGHVDADQ